MQMPVNTFKQRLRAGEMQYGLWLGLSQTISTEICAGAGFDWLLVDAEHGPNDLRTILAQMQVVSAYDSHPVVRPPHGDHVLIKQLLETGVQTLMIPMVESAAQAEQLVQAMLYPPHGIRGVGSALARASRWGRITDYAHRANEEMCLLVQVETREGLENLEAIQSVPGVDGVFFGAADLAASFGRLGEADHPEIVGMIEDGLRQVAAVGKFGGVLCGDQRLVARYQQAGARFVAVGVDSMILSAATSALRALYKPADGDGKMGGSY